MPKCALGERLRILGTLGRFRHPGHEGLSASTERGGVLIQGPKAMPKKYTHRPGAPKQCAKRRSGLTRVSPKAGAIPFLRSALACNPQPGLPEWVQRARVILGQRSVFLEAPQQGPWFGSGQVRANILTRTTIPRDCRHEPWTSTFPELQELYESRNVVIFALWFADRVGIYHDRSVRPRQDDTPLRGQGLHSSP